MSGATVSVFLEQNLSTHFYAPITALEFYIFVQRIWHDTMRKAVRDVEPKRDNKKSPLRSDGSEESNYSKQEKKYEQKKESRDSCIQTRSKWFVRLEKKELKILQAAARTKTLPRPRSFTKA
ncbi:hypothetical protein CBL_05399 [Carabus blaptoides fortunei]